MTQKELHRLSRQDVLQLLLAQSEETEQLKKELAETKELLDETEANYQKLRRRLDHKDEQIHRLRDALEEQRKHRRVELIEAGSIAEAALRLNGIFEAAQKAADQYLYNLKLSTEERMRPEDEDLLLEGDDEDEETQSGPVIIQDPVELGQEGEAEAVKPKPEEATEPKPEEAQAPVPEAEAVKPKPGEATEPKPEEAQAPAQEQKRESASGESTDFRTNVSKKGKKTFWQRMGFGGKAR